MSDFLDSWQTRMERHFEALSAQRTDSGLPLFALEHGLLESEIDEIADQLRARLRNHERLSPHWLLWTIYAAEQGYHYEGDEYWQSFQYATPGWDSRNRHFISSWFKRFQRTYNGVMPSGPWAEHFSIIAWPITHAILPRYLQWQFARTLYGLRYRLARLDELDAASIGHVIATNVYYASTRLEQFLQQEELVGRIVLALLHHDEGAGEETLLLATLNRIVGDLDNVRNARGWLKETSRVVSDRFKGIGKGSEPQARSSERDSARRRQQEPNIRPNLRLFHKGSNEWDLQVDIPSFKAVASLNSGVRGFLKKTRCTLNGSSGKKPAGWLLSGRRQAVLKKWPDPDKPLIGFEEQNGTINHLLDSDCRIDRGPFWLFRIGNDGLAREIIGRVVRPGYAYIIASAEPLEKQFDAISDCKINCEDIHALRMQVPPAPSDQFASWLKSKNLELARTIRVWPAGFPGRHWDGEGRSEWLTTEKPCFGIIPDHPVHSYQITIDGAHSLSLTAGEPGQPTFIQLSELPAGRHMMRVQAQREMDTDVAPAPHEGFLELNVREPEPWIAGTASHSGLIVSATPHDVTLNAFWENEFELSVFGPPSRQITPSVVLQNAREEEIFTGQVCGPLELPLTPAIWKRRFSEFLRREKCEWRYLEASSGLLVIDGDDLGRFVMRFEHEARPLRWVLRHGERGLSVRLVDETGMEDVELTCSFFPMERPLAGRKIDSDKAQKGLPVSSPGGLYLAKIGKKRDLLVVSTGLTGSGLEGLGVQPSHGHISGSPQDIVKLIRRLRLWHIAKVEGNLAGARRRQVTDELMAGLMGIMAGWDWSRAEARLIGAQDVDAQLDRLQSMVIQKSGFASAIRLNAGAVSGGYRTLAQWYFELAKRYRICSDQKLCQFVIDFAGRPQSLPLLHLEGLPDLIRQAKDHQTLIRGARLAVLIRMAASGQLPLLIPEANT